MIVQQLNLANFRGFEQIELGFEPDVSVIAGVNGVGKSGILQALAALFSRALPEFTPSTVRPLSFTDEDIYHGKPLLEASAIFTVADQRCHMGTQRLRGDGDSGDQWNSFWQIAYEARATTKPTTFNEMLATRTFTGNLEAGKADVEQALRALKERPHQPLCIYFSPKRQLQGRPKGLPKPAPFEPRSAYQFALDDRSVDLREFMHWFRWQELQARRGEAHAKRMLATLREVVTRFVPGFRDLRIEDKPTLRFVVEKNDIPLVLNQLSDGERGLLAVIFDIARRLAIANPGLDDSIAEGKAIILMDEIELHLHPIWQRQVLRRFTETFKNCQFIVTTHSPQVLGEVEHRCIRYLMHEDDNIIAWTPPRSLGLDTSRVLEEIMDAKARNADIEDALHELSRLIDDENFEAAKQRMTALQVTLGEDDPELTRARALMAFLQGAE